MRCVLKAQTKFNLITLLSNNSLETIWEKFYWRNDSGVSHTQTNHAYTHKSNENKSKLNTVDWVMHANRLIIVMPLIHSENDQNYVKFEQILFYL